ncbi:MAG TPA: hypothetical protein VFA78_00485 [Chloroflexota bacterium]|nr:hypothetical protein [Chloroflexota bacterium]
MFKLLILVVGLVSGAAGATAWLIGPAEELPQGKGLPASVEAVRMRWTEAVHEGQRAGQETEQRLRRQLDSLRRT